MKPLRMAILAVAISASSIPAFANSSSDPAAAYCSDLNAAVQEKMNASMQKRMPSSMPGEFMNDVFGVQEIIDTKVDFGLPSPSSLLDTLFDFAKSKISEGKRALLGEINSTLSSFTKNTGINLNAQSGSFNAGVIQYTPTLNGSPLSSGAASSAPPLSGAPVYSNMPAQTAPAQSGSSSGSWGADFFKKLF